MRNCPATWRRAAPSARRSPISVLRSSTGEAGDGAAAVRVVERTRPDVVLMDIRMPGMDGIEATRRIVAAAPRIAVLVLTTFDLDEYVYGALCSGRAVSYSRTRSPTTC
jgi:DNA-binding NarL/FixJ family response regulator